MQGTRLNTKRRRGFAVFLGMLGLFLAAIVAVPLYNNLTSPDPHDVVAAVRAENRLLFERAGVPPGATPHGHYDEDVAVRGGVVVVLSREFAVAGTFAETLAWYAPRLDAQGWRPFDRARWRDFVVRYCKAPWLLEIARRADFSNERRPLHRFNLRLDWLRGMGESGCPAP